MCIFTLTLAFLGGAAPALFHDDFSRYPLSPEGQPSWRPLRGEWRAADGKLLHSSEEDLSATGANFQPPRRFRLETRFRTLAGLPGEGLLFNLGGNPKPGKGPASAQLVRVDPEGLYYGHIDSAGEFHGEGPVPALVEGQVWNDLAVTADGAGLYSIDWNGRRVARGIPLWYDRGAIGLVAGRGRSEFAYCSVQPVDAGEAPPPQNEKDEEARAIDLALSAAGDLVLLTLAGPAVRVEGPDRTVKARFGSAGDRRHSVALAVGPGGEVYVLDESGTIERYPAEQGAPDGDPAKIPADSKPRLLTPSPPLDGARDLAVFPDGRLAVAEARGGQIAILAPDGARLQAVGKRSEGAGGLERPSAVAVDSAGRILASDQKACRVSAFAADGKGLYALAEKSAWLAPPGPIAVGPGDILAVLGRFAYYETGGAIRFLARDLAPRGFVAGFAVEDFAEEGGLAIDPRSGSTFYLSRKDGRIYHLPAGLTGAADVQPRIEAAEGGVTVSWNSLCDPPAGGARLQHRPAGAGEWADVPAAAVDRRSFRAVIPAAGLDPLAPREFRFLPHYAARPELGWSKAYRFYPPEPPGKRRYLDLSIACAVYARFEEDQEGGKKHRFEIKPELIGAKVRAEFERAREFYLRNTRFRLNIHADIVVVESAPASVRGGWLDPTQVKNDLRDPLSKLGKKPEDYDSFIGTWIEPGYRADLPDDLGAVGGGGLTSFAYSSFGLGGGLSWLFCHEYHHQIDAFFNRSGHLGYPLNHPDATVELGRYGQHWDCNAFFLRGWPSVDWFFSSFGRVLLADDADGDGVPDRDPALSLDEGRLGSDPARKDTDDDGLDDLAEATAGTFHSSDPRIPDTDGDGLADGADPQPLHRARPDLEKGTPQLDGQPAQGEWQELGEIAEAGVRVGARWDPENFYISAASRRPVVLSIDVDGADNGWFLEPDNVSAELNLDGAAAPTIHGAKGARAVGSGGPAAPAATAPNPTAPNPAVPNSAVLVSAVLISEIAIPWSAMKLGARAPGEKLGLLIRASYKDGERRRELFLFEPWELFELTLR